VQLKLLNHTFFDDDVNKKGRFGFKGVFLVRKVYLLDFKEIVFPNFFGFFNGFLLNLIIKINVFVLRIVHFFKRLVNNKFLSGIFYLLK